MTEEAAIFQASVQGFRTNASRGVVVITIESPIEYHAKIAGMIPHGSWVAVAKLAQQPEKKEQLKGPKSLAQEAGKMCASVEFRNFLWNEFETTGGILWADFVEEEAIKLVRDQCGVQSRSEIIAGTPAADKWNDLIARFEYWRRGK